MGRCYIVCVAVLISLIVGHMGDDDSDLAVALAVLASQPASLRWRQQSQHQQEEDSDLAVALAVLAEQPHVPLSRADCLSKARYGKLKKSKRAVPEHAQRQVDATNNEVLGRGLC